MVEKVSIFSKFHYNKYVLRATSDKKLVTFFCNENVTVYKNLRKTMSLLSFYFLLQRNTAF